MQPWNLLLAIQMLLGASIASFFLVGKCGFKQVRLYVAFAAVLLIEPRLFITIAPTFIFLLVVFKNGKITPPLFWANAFLGLASTFPILNLIWGLISPIAINNIISILIIVVTGTLCMRKYKNYSLAFTLATFTFFWSAYGNSWHLIGANLSMPYACLSLLIFLYLHVVSTKFKGSVVHIVYKHATRRKFKRRSRREIIT